MPASLRRRELAAAVLAPFLGRSAPRRPNFLFVLTDDHRHDALGCSGNRLIDTPAMDGIARRGVRFRQACVTMSVCSASRAAILTGRYGSRNGVMGLDAGIHPGERVFPELLREAGYRNGYLGKWHLKSPANPEQAAFETAAWFYSNGAHFDRHVTEFGRPAVAPGFLEDYLAGHAVRFLEQTARDPRPFFLHLSTQLPHLDHRMRWNARPETLARYKARRVRAPASWNDALGGKPEYLKTCRNRMQGLKYGYDRRERIEEHTREYWAAITELDACLSCVFEALRRLGLEENTWVMLAGDNGWFLGEHGFTSKVLPYEESIRIPLLAAGPGARRGAVRDELVLNADIAATILDLARAGPPAGLHGRSFAALLRGEGEPGWRDGAYYEGLRPELGARPTRALRTRKRKYIQTLDERTRSKIEFEELYDLERDPGERNNLASRPESAAVLDEMKARLSRLAATL